MKKNVKLKNVDFNRKTYCGKTCYVTMEKNMVLWKKLWYCTEHYGTIPKTMVLYRKLWYYGKKDVTCTIPKTTEFFVTAVS